MPDLKNDTIIALQMSCPMVLLENERKFGIFSMFQYWNSIYWCEGIRKKSALYDPCVIKTGTQFWCVMGGEGLRATCNLTGSDTEGNFIT